MKFYYILHPRPVVIIGSGSFNENKINFMAASWITPLSEEPKLIGFACYYENYTSELIKKYKQFSVNIVEDIDLIWKVGTTSGKEIDKVKEFNIKVKKGKVLDVPIIEDCLAFAECKLYKETELGDHYFFAGEVKNWEAKNFGKFGYEEFWRVPLHKSGKSFAFPNKTLKFVK